MPVLANSLSGRRGGAACLPGVRCLQRREGSLPSRQLSLTLLVWRAGSKAVLQGGAESLESSASQKGWQKGSFFEYRLSGPIKAHMETDFEGGVESAPAFITGYCRLGGLNSRNSFLTVWRPDAQDQGVSQCGWVLVSSTRKGPPSCLHMMQGGNLGASFPCMGTNPMRGRGDLHLKTSVNLIT